MEIAGRLWTRLCLESSSNGSVPNVEVTDLFELLQPQEFQAAMTFLQQIGAVELLLPEETAQLAVGRRPTGRLMSIAFGGKWLFFRITPPRDLQTRIAAQLSFDPPEVDDDLDVPAIVAEIGLTVDDLRSASQIPLELDQFELMRQMPSHFFAQAWKRMKDVGNVSQMNMILASLARLMDEQPQMRKDAETRKMRLKTAFELASALVRETEEAVAGARNGLVREPVPEAVRHEVWRRDLGHCVRCGSQEKLHFDHIIPVSKGGSNTARNLQLLCEQCNLRKGDTI